MPLSFLNGQAGEIPYAEAAAAIPGELLSREDFAGAAAALQSLAGHAGADGVIPGSAADKSPDAMANLWFVRAAHLFRAMGGDKAVAGALLPVSKRIVQTFIGGGVGGVKMDDGGLLSSASPELASQGLRLNALWYSALESTGADLKAAGDKSGDHFERLAGRFRRAFAKSYWCEGHNCVCPPYRRTADSHGELPDAEQLLLTILPASPIPRTKQRQLLQLVRSKLLGQTGLVVDHPTLGRVESLMHRAWLASGLMNAADNPASVQGDAATVIGPLEKLSQAAGDGMPAYYREGQAVGGGDAVATAEISGAIRQVRR
jgi:hypothetical protein